MKNYYFGEGCVYQHVKLGFPLLYRCTRYDNVEYEKGYGSCTEEKCPLKVKRNSE
jgi:hypothetical protein